MSNEQTEALIASIKAEHERFAEKNKSAARGQEPEDKAELRAETTGHNIMMVDAIRIIREHTRATPSPAPSDTLESGAEPEAEAWTWLESKWLNIEAGHDPNDRDYSADEMVDAFIAGRERRLAPAPMTDTLERREAIKAALRAELERQCGIGAGNFYVDSETGLWDVVADLDADAIATALSLPAREVSGNDVEASAWAWLDQTFGSESDDPVDRAYAADEMVDAFHAGRAALTTTPAPREKLEADLVEAKETLDAAIDCEVALIGHLTETGRPTLAAYYREFADKHRATLNRLSGEG